MISDSLLHLWSVGVELENVTAQQTADMAQELLEARRKIEKLELVIETNRAMLNDVY